MNQEELNEVARRANHAAREGRRRRTCSACGGRGRSAALGPCARCNGLGDVPPTPGSHTVLLNVERDSHKVAPIVDGMYPLCAGGPLGRVVAWNPDCETELLVRFDPNDLLRWAMDQGAQLPEGS